MVVQPTTIPAKRHKRNIPMTTRIIELKMKYGERDYTKLDSLQEKGWQIKDWNTVSTPDMEWQGFNVRHFIIMMQEPGWFR